jgi:5'-deoxynucleotidase YfbR-like HD superfamily hydrolase
MIDSKGNDAVKAYIATVTGKKFFLLSPKLEDIDIQDIAHALAMQCRWTGHTKFHYSIAQHSYYCSFLGPESEAFDRLMHDASEAYIGDLNRPLKHYTEAGIAYRRQEAVIQRAIAERFGFSIIEPISVKIADNMMLYAEKNQIMNIRFEASDYQGGTKIDTTAADVIIERWSPEQAKQMFLNRFEELYKTRVN